MQSVEDFCCLDSDMLDLRCKRYFLFSFLCLFKTLSIAVCFRTSIFSKKCICYWYFCYSMFYLSCKACCSWPLFVFRFFLFSGQQISGIWKESIQCVKNNITLLTLAFFNTKVEPWVIYRLFKNFTLTFLVYSIKCSVLAGI